MVSVFRFSPCAKSAARRRHAQQQTVGCLNSGSSRTSAKPNGNPLASLLVRRILDGLCGGLVQVLPVWPSFESRQFPLGMGYRVRFAGEGVTPFSGISTTNWAFDVNGVHVHSLRRVEAVRPLWISNCTTTEAYGSLVFSVVEAQFCVAG